MKMFLDKSSVIGALVGIGIVLSTNQVFADAISVLAFETKIVFQTQNWFSSLQLMREQGLDVHVASPIMATSVSNAKKAIPPLAGGLKGT